MPVTAVERQLQLKAVEAALTVRAATDPQRQNEAQHDLAAAVAELSTDAQWELTRALGLLEGELSAAAWTRGADRG